MKKMIEFMRRLNADPDLDTRAIIKRKDRYFLVTSQMRELKEDFFYAGTYLGKTRKGLFFPSFPLLSMISEKNANKVMINRRAEWLFVCGRDLFGRGIVRTRGSSRRGDLTLVLNENGDCLGFGKIIHDLNEMKKGVAVKNIADVGDFLRRERNADDR